jgi:hypothetical protein
MLQTQMNLWLFDIKLLKIKVITLCLSQVANARAPGNRRLCEKAEVF